MGEVTHNSCMSARDSWGLDSPYTAGLGFTIVRKEVAFYLALLQAIQPWIRQTYKTNDLHYSIRFSTSPFHLI
jgi:ABC-type uncharacterized transport system YnjBCD permease subunit